MLFFLIVSVLEKLADMGAYGTLPLEKRDKNSLGERIDK